MRLPQTRRHQKSLTQSRRMRLPQTRRHQKSLTQKAAKQRTACMRCGAKKMPGPQTLGAQKPRRGKMTATKPQKNGLKMKEQTIGMRKNGLKTKKVGQTPTSQHSCTGWFSFCYDHILECSCFAFCNN